MKKNKNKTSQVNHPADHKHHPSSPVPAPPPAVQPGASPFDDYVVPAAFSADAQALFEKECHESEGAGLHSPHRKFVPLLAMLIHTVEVGSGQVSITALERGIKWVRFLTGHAAEGIEVHPDSTRSAEQPSAAKRERSRVTRTPVHTDPVRKPSTTAAKAGAPTAKAAAKKMPSRGKSSPWMKSAATPADTGAGMPVAVSKINGTPPPPAPATNNVVNQAAEPPAITQPATAFLPPSPAPARTPLANTEPPSRAMAQPAGMHTPPPPAPLHPAMQPPPAPDPHSIALTQSWQSNWPAPPCSPSSVANMPGNMPWPPPTLPAGMTSPPSPPSTAHGTLPPPPPPPPASYVPPAPPPPASYIPSHAGH